jgi:hypothetical protein
MAKAPKEPAKSKAKSDAPKVAKPKAAAPAAPQPVLVSDKAPEIKKAKIDRVAVTATLSKQFQAVRDTLTATNSGIKQPRQLRWALKSLAMAEEAAARAIQHSE